MPAEWMQPEAVDGSIRDEAWERMRDARAARIAGEPRLQAVVSVATVPASYAEKAMASLLQLHRELMDEKDQRVEMCQTLMSKEQALAEMAGYVRLLEERLYAANEKLAEREWAEFQEQESRRTRPGASEVAAGGQAVAAMPEPGAAERDGWRVW